MPDDAAVTISGTAPEASVRSAASTAEVEAAFTLLDNVLGSTRSWPGTRQRLLPQYMGDPALLSLAFLGGAVVGAVGCDGASGITVVAVAEHCRWSGVGRRLLALAEDTLRSRGARTSGLGSLDGAVDFYLRNGYVPQLLVQFAPEAGEPEAIIEQMLAGVLADHEVHRAAWQGHPQLWLQSSTLDWDLKHAIEATAEGVVAQYVMSKVLTDSN